MSTIRTVQTKLRAPPSFNVLGAIDTNSPPGLPYRAQEIDLYFEKPSQPSYSSFSTPTPVNNSGSFSRRNAASTSSLSPYASPYKPRSAPRSTNTSSQFHAQNQYHLQSQRAGARAGRGAPSLSSYPSQGYDSELPGVNYSQTSSGGHNNVGGSLLMDPIFNGVPTYSLSSRFDPFGDLSASEKTSIPSHKNRTTFTPSPANSTALTQSPGAGTGREPAYTHYYYYDKSTNSPMLAYGARQSNNNRINLNHPHNQSNPKFRGNNNTLQTRNHYNNRRPSSFSPSRSPSPPSTVQVNQQASFISFPNTTPSRSPSPPSSIGVSLPLSVTPKTEGNLPVDPLPTPVRTRKRSNAFREPPKAVQPTVPSSSPPPEIKPKVVQKKDDSSMASKLVAAMLLNRVDATGRSRCAGSATKRLGLGAGYVKSGLSRVVFVEC